MQRQYLKLGLLTLAFMVIGFGSYIVSRAGRATITAEPSREPIVLTTKADQAGDWSLNYEGPLEPGSHRVLVRTEQEGVTSDPEEISFTLQEPQAATDSAAPGIVQAPSPQPVLYPANIPKIKVKKVAKQLFPPAAGGLVPQVRSVGTLLPRPAKPMINRPKLVKRGKRYKLRVSGNATQPRRRLKIIVRSHNPQLIEVTTDDTGKFDIEVDLILEQGDHELVVSEIDEQGGELTSDSVNFELSYRGDTKPKLGVGFVIVGIGVVIMVMGLLL